MTLNNKIDVRQINFELLRIVSMIMITLCHISMTFGIDNNDWYIRMWAQFFYIGGSTGVNCFVLIGAYFLIDKSFKASRIFKIYSQVLFYSLILFVIGVLTNQPVGMLAVVKTFLPVIFNHYWFITTYLGMVLISPFLNLFIAKLKFDQYSLLIGICFLLFCIIPTFSAQVPYNDNLSWFCFLYFITGYFKLYHTKIKKILSKPIVFIVMWISIWGTSVIMTLLAGRISAFGDGINFFSGKYIIPEVINSISIFLFFENKVMSFRLINKIGHRTLASYLVQSNYMMIPVRISLLSFIFMNTPKWCYPLNACLVALFMVLFGVILEYVREFVFCILQLNKLITVCSFKIDSLIEKIRTYCKESLI